ncbi:glycosyltransferase [Methanobrevibacter sp.]|uniref:glycosyltransferase n=1 Tax=Methanobrevibacter sp. TaxID=66852 RepID=UPI00388F9E2E
MSEIKVSIIVPVYNTGNYLEECLDSIVNQSLKDIEIICVNDGSTDNSLKILEEYAKKDSRVKILTIENSGLSIARNVGIKHANGKYIGFVDSDDFVNEYMFEKLYVSCELNNLDLSICKISLFDNVTGKFYDDMEYYNLSVFENLEKDVFNADDTTSFTCDIVVNAYNKLYRKSLLEDNSIEFPPHLIFEDEVFFIKSYLLAQRISVVNEFLYYYRINRDGSISYLDKENNYVDMVYVYKKEREFFKQVNKYSEYKVALANRMLFLIFARYTQTAPKYKENFYNVLKEDLIEVLADDEIKNNLSLNVKNRTLKLIESKDYEEFSKMDQFKIFSLIVVCHNAESYLEMGITSILNQHFSFESNIQMILVNNGSEDNTDSICRKYQHLYPENIVYICNDEELDLDIVQSEAEKYTKGDYTILLEEPYKLNSDVLSSIVLKINDELCDALVVTIHHFDGDFDKSKFENYYRDIHSSGINT